ncbi:MAG: serine hydrolase [Flavobacteriales bacterium]|nr:serine hydrolase [Flavobacteriales bacterium]
MKTLKKIFLALLIIAALLHITLYLSGNTHLYKAIVSTYLAGQTGPSIDEYQKFDFDTIKTNTPTPWNVSKTYNTYQLTEEQENIFSENQTAAFLVIKNDSIVFEKYWEKYNEHSHTNSFSVAKTFTALAVGVAIKEGKIKSVNDKAIRYLPELKGSFANEITLHHLLNMTAGINFDESYDHPLGFMAKVYYGKNIKDLTFTYQSVLKPGSTFYYQGGNTLLLSYIIERVSGMPISNYFEEKIWKPIGAEQPAFWSKDNQGTIKAYCCFYSNARDFARIGKLILHTGWWDGKEIIPKNFMLQAFQPVNTPDASGQTVDFYGYQLWMTTYQNRPIYFARGIKGQYIFVIPNENLIVVRLGKKRSDEYINGHPSEIYKYLNTAFSIAK